MADSSLKKWTPAILFLLCLAGLGFSIYLTQTHYALLAGTIEKSGCSFNSTFDCDVVSLSSYSTIFGFPLSGIGIIFYLVLGSMALCAQFFRRPIARAMIHWVVVLSLLALIADLYLLIVMVFVLKTICINCVATYIVNICIFFLARKNMSRELQHKGFFVKPQETFKVMFQPLCDFSEKKGQLLATWLGLFLALGLGIGGTVYLQQPVLANHGGNNGNTNVQKEVKEKIRALLKKAPKITEDFELGHSPIKGSEKAPLTFVEFSDFECPHCKRTAELFAMSMPNYKDEVRLVFKNYPLDRSCNPKMERDLHQKACLFAYAVVCAKKQPPRDLSWAMHDLIFSKGKSLSMDNIGAEAAKLGLEEGSFMGCLILEETRKTVQRDIALGNRVNVHSTPTIFLNGRLLSSPQLLQPDYFPLLIEVALEEFS